MTLPREMEDGTDLDDLFRAHYGRITRVIGRVIQDQARAEELAVEVFLKWSRKSGVRGEQTQGWLYRTAVREALDELRRYSRRSRFERLFASFRQAPRTPEELQVSDSEQQNVRRVFGVLRRRDTAILLLWGEGMSYQEMASALEVKPSYVGSLLSRAQDAFRKEYVSRYGER